MRQTLQIAEGTYVVVERTERGTFELALATLVPNDQMRFHHPAMQARVAQVEKDFSRGGFTRTEAPDDTQALLPGYPQAAIAPIIGKKAGLSRDGVVGAVQEELRQPLARGAAGRR